MPLLPRTGGLHGKPLEDITFIEFQKGVCEEWFQSDTHFRHYMLQRQVLDEDGQNVSLTLRSIAVFLRTGIVLGMHKCAECSGPTRLECSKSSSDGGVRYRRTCRTSGHKHMNHSVNSCSFLSKVNINNWMPFLRIMNMLRLGLPWVRITDEMRAGYGNVKDDTMLGWRRLYQGSLGKALVNTNQMKVGGANHTVVIDECLVGTHPEDRWSLGNRGINKNGAHEQERADARHEATSMKVAKGSMKVFPARTIKKGERKALRSFALIKRPAASFSSHMKRPSASVSMKRPSASGSMKRPSASGCIKRPSAHRRPLRILKKPAANLKLNGKWLWLAVCVGRGNQVFTHENGLKKITYRLLPRTSQAVNNKPRGLYEIRDTLLSRIHKKSVLVFDGWTATTKAADQLGYAHPPSVKHGRLHIEESDMQEYMFYVNVNP